MPTKFFKVMTQLNEGSTSLAWMGVYRLMAVAGLPTLRLDQPQQAPSSSDLSSLQSVSRVLKVRLGMKKRLSLLPLPRVFLESLDCSGGAKAKSTPILHDNDIVVISRSNAARVADAGHLFLSPGGGIIMTTSNLINWII